MSRIVQGMTVTLDQILEAYDRLGSVHKAGRELGVSHSKVHRAAVANRPGRKGKKITEAQRSQIKDYYERTPAATFVLADIAAKVGLPRTSVSAIAGQMGLSDRCRPANPNSKKHRPVWGGPGNRPHPRGFLGGSHTEETKAALAENTKRAWVEWRAEKRGPADPESIQRRADMTSKRMAAYPASKGLYSRGKQGLREDINLYVRSSWEANYARYLNWLVARGEIDSWEYEPETFWFDAIKRGVRSYKPDFLIREKGKSYFVELKGYMDDKSKTKLKRMAKYHPAVDLRLVGAKEYRAIEKVMKPMLPLWE